MKKVFVFEYRTRGECGPNQHWMAAEFSSLAKARQWAKAEYCDLDGQGWFVPGSMEPYNPRDKRHRRLVGDDLQDCLEELFGQDASAAFVMASSD